MKHFLVLMSQTGGCDYTIGCGNTWAWYKGPDRETVGAQVMKDFGMDYMADHERGINKTFELIEVADRVDLGPLALELQQRYNTLQAEKAAKKKEAEELAELERLQKKYKK